MKHTKYLLCIVMTFCLLLAGCSQGGSVKEFEPDALAQEITSKLQFEDQMEAIDENVIYTLYTIDKEQIDKAVVYMGSGATSEEIAVFKAKDAAYMDSLKEALQKRVANKKKDFEDYMPEQMPKLDKPVIVTKGNYAVLCISGSDSDAQKLIDDYMKA